MTKLFITLLVLALFAPAAYAADTAPGASCTTSGQVRATGGASDTPRTLLCNGTTWVAVNEVSSTGKTAIQVDNDTGSCTSAKLGRLRYDGTSAWEYCNGTAWTALATGGGGGGGGWLYGQ